MHDPVQLLRELVEYFGDEPCVYDRNEFCQTHYQQRPCMVERARECLKQQGPVGPKCCDECTGRGCEDEHLCPAIGCRNVVVGHAYCTECNGGDDAA